MTFYAVPGSPYVTFEYDKATPFLTSLNGKIQSFNGQTLESGGNGISKRLLGGIGAD
jgi:endo-1,3(4)-beta-glucanase